MGAKGLTRRQEEQLVQVGRGCQSRSELKGPNPG